jgi:2,4-dienoyl-CoA reductase [(3E)-enoyl-CoA-producing], peroxisomal
VSTGGDAAAPHPVFRAGLFAGQVALVTGGGTGIGFGISELLASLGAHVVIASRKPEHIEAAAEKLRARGWQATPMPLDVRDPERVRAVVARVTADLGRIDVLVNNAAGNFYVPSESMSPNAWRSVLEIDLFGTFYCSQAVLPAMRERGGGRIVNISMTLHYRGWPLMAHATAAKGGIDALTRTLAVEWAPHGVRVNAVAPGPIPTEGVQKAFAVPAATPGAGGPAAGDVFGMERGGAARAEQAPPAIPIPLGRWGRPSDIAQMVAYLASPAAEWITGAIFVVDGGEWLAKPTR